MEILPHSQYTYTEMNRLFKSFSYAFSGLAFVWKEELNFRVQVCAACVAVLCMIIFDFSYSEIGLFIIAITLVLIAETINTAFEDTLNIVEPKQNPAVGRIKDVAAGVVVLCVLCAISIGAFTVFFHFW